jgi:DNA-binding CsgD family transcriptional regulator/tetratricopeptide (TPR) repeat protein
MVILEDLQWASPSSLELFAFLAATFRRDRIVLVGTVGKDMALGTNPGQDMARLLRGLKRQANYLEIRVPALSKSELEELADALVTGVPAKRVSELARRSGGNPLFVEQLCAYAGTGADDLPPSLTSLIIARLDSLGSPTRRVIDLLATGARPLPGGVLAAATNYSPPRLERALAVLRREGFLSETADGYSVRHSLVTEIAYESLHGRDRAHIHAVLAKAMAQSPTPPIPSSSATAERAYHLRMSHQIADACEAFVQAARAARDARAYAEGKRHFQAALELLAGLDHQEQTRLGRLGVVQEAAEVAFASGDASLAVRLLRSELAMTNGGPPGVEGRLRRRLGSYLLGLTEDREAITELETATRLLGSPSDLTERGRAVGTLGASLMLVGEYRQCRRFSREALRIARDVGDVFMQSQALNFLGVAEANLGNINPGLHLLDRAVEIGRISGRADAEYEAILNRSEILQLADQLDAASDTASAAAERARSEGLFGGVGAMLVAAASSALIQGGRWQHADSLIQTGLRTVALQEARANLLALRGWLRMAHGDFARARKALTLSRRAMRPDRVDVLPIVVTADAEMALWAGDLATAHELVREGLETMANSDGAFARLRLISLAVRIEADTAQRALLLNLPTKHEEAVAAAQKAAAEAELLPIGDQAPAGVRAERRLIVAEADRAAGVLELDVWEEIRDLWQLAGRPYPSAYANLRLAEAGLREHERGVARLALDEASRTSATLGARPLESEIVAVAKRARIPLTNAEGHTSRRTHPMGLTNREAEVLGLIARGLTNRKIADALFVSEATVASHVSHVLSKLGARTRQEAAAAATDIPLDT